MKEVNWLFGKDGALFQASAQGNQELAKELVADGANVNVTSSKGYTPLHRAAEYGHKDLVEFLLKNGANADAMSKQGETPLSLAEQKRHDDIVMCLHQHV